MPVGRCMLVAGGNSETRLDERGWRAIFVALGTVELRRAGGEAERLDAGAGAALGCEALVLSGCGPETRYWLWEMRAAQNAAAAAAEGLHEMLQHDLAQTTDIANPELCLRLERVDLTLGADTPRHTHAGPGLRVLLSGRLDARVGETRVSLSEGDAWLERGPGEPVEGHADPEVPTAFVRLMMLPPDMAGRDSFIPWNSAEGDLPRPASYQRFFEERIRLS